MLEAARGVAALAEDIVISELRQYPDYSLLVVGHSLGGSVAAVLATLWEEKFPNIHVYAYGAACVTTETGTKSRAKIVSVMGEGDPFSCLSLGHVADVSVALAELCDNPDLRTTILMRTDGRLEDMDERDLVWCSSTMQELRRSMKGEKLYPPGRLLYLSKPDKRQRHVYAREVPTHFFQDLVIGPRMFDLSRHVPRLYETRLRDCVATMATSVPDNM